MRVTLECGCNIDDEFKNTVHQDGADRSQRDKEAKVFHYPLEGSPESLCVKCDMYRPCSCDAQGS